MKKKEEKMKFYWTRTYIFSVQRTASYLLGYRGIVKFSFIKVIVPQSKANILRRFPIIGRKVIEYAYVSGQCRQIILYACNMFVFV